MDIKVYIYSRISSSTFPPQLKIVKAKHINAQVALGPGHRCQLRPGIRRLAGRGSSEPSVEAKGWNCDGCERHFAAGAPSGSASWSSEVTKSFIIALQCFIFIIYI